MKKLEKYSDSLQEILIACKINNINANMKKLLNDITNGAKTKDIIKNLHKYV